MMTYSPINYRRMDWFRCNRAGDWRDLNGPRDLSTTQAALTRQAYLGYLKD